MKVSTTVRFTIAALLAASASLSAWAGDTGASNPLTTIQRTLKDIDLRLTTAEQSQATIKLKLDALTVAFGDDADLKVLLDSTLHLLEINDAVGVDIVNLEVKLAATIDLLVTMQSDPSNSIAQLTAIKKSLLQARALAKRTGIDSDQSDALHTEIKLLALAIEEKIG